MKARILIAMHYLEIGGAESALIGLLHAFDPSRADVDLFLYARRGELLRHVPSWVRVLPEIPAYAAIEIPMAQAVRRGHVAVAAARWAARRQFMRYVRRNRPPEWSAHFGYIGRCLTPVLPSLRRFGRYDLAISFMAPHDYVLRHVDAARRACWIHTDYSRIDVNAALELPVWEGYDHIVSISTAVTEAFCKRFPSLRAKITEIANIAPEALIRAGAAMPVADVTPTPGRVRLLTIGRYCYAKKLEDIPAIARRLKDAGTDVDWNIIGYGGSDDYIRRAIEKHDVADRVHLLGKRDNPYPYIAAADWYVQPSRFEGRSVVVDEARILGVPVILTDYPTARAQVRDGVDGIVVPMPVEQCAEAMAAAISHPTLRARIAANLSENDFTNASEIEKIYRLTGL